MAQYVLAGVAQCPNFARAEILADDLSINLPDFKVHKIVFSDSEWKGWLKNTCSQHGWKHESSPLVWRELVDRGGAGTYLGGWEDFKKMTEHWYGYSDKLAAALVTDVSSENKTTYQQDKAAAVKTPIVPVRVCVVGAAQPLAYSFVPLLFNSCFTDVPLSIILQDDKEHAKSLEGVVMEIEDCASCELHAVTISHDLKTAAKDADYLVILDSLDTSSHPDRFLLVKAVNTFYKNIAAALKGSVKPEAKVVVNGYKACLGAMLLKHYGLKNDNITVVTALDEQRLRAKLAKKLKVLPNDITDITVWGNVPIHHVASPAIATVSNHEGAITGPADYNKTVFDAVNENDWEYSNVDARNDRDSQILSSTGHKSNMTSALAIYRHIASVVKGSDATTMACVSSGQFGTTPGVVFGFPVAVSGGIVEVRDVPQVSEKVKELIKLQNSQLLMEQKVALGECDDVEKALELVEGALWTILETPKLKRTLEEKETERLATEEAEKKAAEVRAKEEAKKKAEDDALKQAANEAAAAAAAEDEGEFEED